MIATLWQGAYSIHRHCQQMAFSALFRQQFCSINGQGAGWHRSFDLGLKLDGQILEIVFLRC